MTTDGGSIVVELLQLSVYVPAQVPAGSCPCWSGADLEKNMNTAEAAGSTAMWHVYVGQDLTEQSADFTEQGGTKPVAQMFVRLGPTPNTFSCGLRAAPTAPYWTDKLVPLENADAHRACQTLLYAQMAQKITTRWLVTYVQGLPKDAQVEVTLTVTPPSKPEQVVDINMEDNVRLHWLFGEWPDGTAWSASISKPATAVCTLPVKTGTLSLGTTAVKVFCTSDELSCDHRDNDGDGQFDEDDGGDSDGDGVPDDCDTSPQLDCKDYFDVAAFDTLIAQYPAAKRYVDADDSQLPKWLQGAMIDQFTGVIDLRQESPYAAWVIGVATLLDKSTTVLNTCMDDNDGKGACKTLKLDEDGVIGFGLPAAEAAACRDVAKYAVDVVAYASISGGDMHSCALTSSNAVECWGFDSHHQVSDAPESGTFIGVSAGSKHSCALTSGNAVQCWGFDSHHQVSDAPKSGTFVAVSAGRAHDCALTSSGDVQCWGDDNYGQVSDTPKTGTFTTVSAGGSHSCALSETGAVKCWGKDSNGQVSGTPTGMFTAVSAGSNHNCAVTSVGDVQCWGRDEDGQVSKAPKSGKFTAVSAGDSHSCALGDTGAVKCWGKDDVGQVSNAPAGSFTKLDAGGYHICALTPLGDIRCWGLGTFGQIAVP